ncbi:MAG: homoserine kinase [Bacteroidetes bacterium]|nr:MAG: homoserine kinase [Bacteroidota bacterium]
MSKEIKVFAPATVANVSCGFDVLGFAVDSPGDEAIVKMVDKQGVIITKITGDGGRLPLDPNKNTVSATIIKMLDHLGEKRGFEIELHKKMPLGSGLGSSAASSVAGIFAVNELLGNPLSKIQLLPFAMEGERLASGTAHADNVAPALYGGFVLIRSYNPLDVISIHTPSDLHAAIVHPHIEVETRDARSILRKDIKLKDAITQWGNVAGLVTGLLTDDYNLIGRSMQDVIVEPLRAILIPGFYEVKEAAMDAGALGGGISGSGPSIFSVSKGKETAEKAGKAMVDAFKKIGIESDLFVSKINAKGPIVI